MESKPKQPPYIGDFVQQKIGQVWTAGDAAEVMRQWRRMDELAQEMHRVAFRRGQEDVESRRSR